jgi:hypothetical protein
MARKGLFLVGLLVATLLVPVAVSLLGAADCPDTVMAPQGPCPVIQYFCSACPGPLCNGTNCEEDQAQTNNWTCQYAQNSGYICGPYRDSSGNWVTALCTIRYGCYYSLMTKVCRPNGGNALQPGYYNVVQHFFCY